MKARDLKPGDVFDAGRKKVFDTMRRGRRVLVLYLYKVRDEDGNEDGNERWYHQRVLPAVSFDVMKDVK